MQRNREGSRRRGWWFSFFTTPLSLYKFKYKGKGMTASCHWIEGREYKNALCGTWIGIGTQTRMEKMMEEVTNIAMGLGLGVAVAVAVAVRGKG